MEPEYLTPEYVLYVRSRLRWSRADRRAYQNLIGRLQSMPCEEIRELTGRCFQYAMNELRSERGAGSIDAALEVGRFVAKEDRRFVARELESFVRALATTMVTRGTGGRSRSIDAEDWYWPLRSCLTGLHVLDPTGFNTVIEFLTSVAAEAKDEALGSGIQELNNLIRSVGKAGSR